MPFFWRSKRQVVFFFLIGKNESRRAVPHRALERRIAPRGLAVPAERDGVIANPSAAARADRAGDLKKKQNKTGMNRRCRAPSAHIGFVGLCAHPPSQTRHGDFAEARREISCVFLPGDCGSERVDKRRRA